MKTPTICLLALIPLAGLLAWSPPGVGAQDPPGAVSNEPGALPPAAEKRIRSVLAELDQDRRGNMNVPEEDGRLLYLLTRSMNAKNVVEIGTSNGYSGIWMAMALRSTGGHLTTFDIDPGRSAKAKANFEKAGVSDLVTQVLGDAHEKVLELKEPIDLLFIDADKEGYHDYLKKLQPLVRVGGLILGHNMKRPNPSADFVEASSNDPDLETLFLHMDGAGISVSVKKR